MTPYDARCILRRLLVTTYRCRDAFIDAAFSVVPRSLTIFFVRRAQHQQRIADFLTQRIDAEDSRHLVLLRGRPVSPAWGRRLPSRRRARDPVPLLDSCIRVLDTSILEFYRAIGPATPKDRQITLERHHDWMRWSREELLSMQRLHKPRHLRLLADVDEEEALQVGDAIWIDSPLDAPDREAWFAELVPLEGVAVRD